MVNVKPMPNGPYQVEGARIVDADGNEVKAECTHYLCRCGQSGNKPFCDGTHAKVDFQAD